MLTDFADIRTLQPILWSDQKPEIMGILELILFLICLALLIVGFLVSVVIIKSEPFPNLTPLKGEDSFKDAKTGK